MHCNIMIVETAIVSDLKPRCELKEMTIVSYFMTTNRNQTSLKICFMTASVSQSLRQNHLPLFVVGLDANHHYHIERIEER